MFRWEFHKAPFSKFVLGKELKYEYTVGSLFCLKATTAKQGCQNQCRKCQVSANQGTEFHFKTLELQQMVLFPTHYPHHCSDLCPARVDIPSTEQDLQSAIRSHTELTLRGFVQLFSSLESGDFNFSRTSWSKSALKGTFISFSPFKDFLKSIADRREFIPC